MLSAKKHCFFLSGIILFLMFGCSIVRYYEIKPNRVIENRMPSVNIIIDSLSLSNNINIEKMMIFRNNEKKIKSDITEVLLYDFNNNICENYVQKIGSVNCIITRADISTVSSKNKLFDLYLIQMSNIYNYPLIPRKSDVELLIELNDLNNRLIKSYLVTGNSTLKNTFSKGYCSNLIDRVALNIALTNALNNLKDSISRDLSYINKSFKSTLSKTQYVNYERLKKREVFIRDSIMRVVSNNDSLRLSNAIILYNSGCYKLNSNDFTGAINDFDKSIEYNSIYENSYNNRGVAYLNLGKYSNAISDFNKCLKINPNLEIAKSNKTLAQKAQTEKALKVIGVVTLAIATVGVTVEAINNSTNETNSSKNSSFSEPNVTNNNSINNIPTKHKCGYCNGSGQCPHCNLLGQSNVCMKGSFGGKPCSDVSCLARNHRCKFCGGTHKCPQCNGK